MLLLVVGARVLFPDAADHADRAAAWRERAAFVVVPAFAIGVLSGLLANSGGVFLVPMFILLLGLTAARAAGTSIVAAGALTIPTLLVHMSLGHVDWTIALVFGLGLLPGSLAGSLVERAHPGAGRPPAVRRRAGGLRRLVPRPALTVDLVAAPLRELGSGMLGGLRRWVDEWRPSAVTLGAPTFPLIVLFGLNAVDELDRAAFAVLLPDIRDHFDLSNAGALRLVALTTIAVLLIEIPLSFYCDRGNRVRIATIGATVWALFSFGTGGAIVVGSLGMLIVMRIGAGIGRAVVTPTHSSLLSDYYEPAARVKVFSAHRQANSVGQILGPLLAGVIAGVARAGVAVLPLRHPDPRVRR